MPYEKQSWADGPTGGTPMDATRLGYDEQGILDVANAADALMDAVNALIAAQAQQVAMRINGGPTANRPAPLLNAVYRDTDLGKVIYGNGSGWVLGDGTAVGGAGGSNAPQNFTATTQPDNSILCSWNAVAGAASYKLYEIQSPTGVSGATALTTTSTTRTPSTLRQYEYWVTALVSGVESAASNHGICVLPYSAASGGGGGGAGSPAELLGIGGTGGYWNLGIGYSTGHVDRTYQELVAGGTWPPYFLLNTAGTAVQFLVYMNGGTTSANTNYARSELRELTSDGSTKAAWTASTGTHVLEYSFRVNHIQPLKPWVTVGQIHDASSDAVSIKVKGSTTSALSIVASIYDSDQATKLYTSYTVGSTATIRIELTNGTLRLYAGGTSKITSTAMASKGSGHYFKLGSYPQSADDAGGFEVSTEYCSVDVWGVTCTHSPAL